MFGGGRECKFWGVLSGKEIFESSCFGLSVLSKLLQAPLFMGLAWENLLTEGNCEWWGNC